MEMFLVLTDPNVLQNTFIPRDAMQARYMLSSCVCLSVRVRLSQAGIVPKRLKGGLHEQRHTIAHGLWFSGDKHYRRNSHGVTPYGTPSRSGVG